MWRQGFAVLVALALTVTGCASSLPRWRDEAQGLLLRVRSEGADRFFPEEFRNLEETVGQGERLLDGGDRDEAEQFYVLALEKGELLREKADQRRRELAQEEQRRREAERAEQEQRRAEEERRLQEEAAARQGGRDDDGAGRKKGDRSRSTLERNLPVSHTVKRGETLPLIAAQPDIYGDANLWPLIYRANRDQISNPRHIWPGQVLRIPRNSGRDEVSEARRYAREKPL